MARHHYETLQQVFDDAYRGLAAQGFERSAEDDGAGSTCLYRGPEGRRCAVGHCIPDDLYREAYDAVLTLEQVASRVKVFGRIRFDDLRDLQRAHDSGFQPDLMKLNLADFANAHGLTIPSIGEPA